MTVPARIGLITLACRDPEWRTSFARSAGRRFTLCVNLDSMEEVHAAYASLQAIDDVELLEEPEDAFRGGGFSWRDPEGNVWDVAWAKGSALDERGGLTFP